MSDRPANVINIRSLVLCAGQKCEDRDRCRRFRVRGQQEYASFDIDRQRIGGECPALEK